MGIPVKPFSPSSLDTALNCGWMYHERYINKRKEEATDKKDWGNIVHKAFEDFIDTKGEADLPLSLYDHKPYAQTVVNWSGQTFTEMEAALDLHLMPVSNWFQEDVFFRCKLDVLNVDGARARIVDWKTGKVHDKWRQLMLNAIFVFHCYPEVDIVDARFYWLQMTAHTRKVWSRKEEESLWAELLPDIRQYRQMFKDDVWPKRKSGLCNGHCLVTECEHWRPKREWRR